jgi:hypothetical protein
MTSPSEIELKYLVKVVAILAVLLASLWGADSAALTSIVL